MMHFRIQGEVENSVELLHGEKLGELIKKKGFYSQQVLDGNDKQGG